jgi:uncharacterized DUF497 family protein
MAILQLAILTVCTQLGYMAMRFEWNEGKRLENYRRRGIDFILATQVFKDPDHRVLIDDRRDYGEERRLAIGTVEGHMLVVVHTIRGETCRLITAWRIGKNGQRRFEKLLRRGDR